MKHKTRKWIIGAVALLVAMFSFILAWKNNAIPKVNPLSFLSSVGTEISENVLEWQTNAGWVPVSERELTDSEQENFIEALNEADIDFFGKTHEEVFVSGFSNRSDYPEMENYRFGVSTFLGKQLLVIFHNVEIDGEMMYFISISTVPNTNVYWYRLRNPEALKKIDSFSDFLK